MSGILEFQHEESRLAAEAKASRDAEKAAAELAKKERAKYKSDTREQLTLENDGVKLSAQIKSRSYKAIEGLVNDLYSSVGEGDASAIIDVSINALSAKLEEVKVTNEYLAKLEALISLFNSYNGDHIEDFYEQYHACLRARTTAGKVKSLVRSSFVPNITLMKTIIAEYPVPAIELGREYTVGEIYELLLNYDRAMEPHQVDLEVLLQKYQVTVKVDDEPQGFWTKLWNKMKFD